MKTLVVRPDRLGDVILSTPVFSVLKRADPQGEVCAFVRQGVVPILKGLSSIDSFLVFDPEGEHRGWDGLLRLIKQLREKKLDRVIVLQSHPKIALALFLARIPIRVGPWSKIHSYLFYNRGMRQNRSRVTQHEADYNLELLQKIGLTPERLPTSIKISKEVQDQANHWLKENGWSEKKSGEIRVAVHPGMGGSALNWPFENYVSLIEKLLTEGKKVLVTLGPFEKNLAPAIRKLRTSKELLIFESDSIHGVDFLGGLYQQMDLVVAPSTGPLHLAVALERPVLSFYPNLRVQSQKRWGPYPPEELKNLGRAVVLEPETDCRKDDQCMQKLSVEQALDACHRLLSRSKSGLMEERWPNQNHQKQLQSGRPRDFV